VMNSEVRRRYTNYWPWPCRDSAATVRDCVIDLQTWCSSRRLQLNASKTEIMWFGTTANLNRLQAAHKCITIGSAIIEPSLVVRDLGVFFDAELTMHDHVMQVAQTCFCPLRRLRSVRKQLGQETAAQLVSALILTRIDYCNYIVV
jgi:hypothetical protein